MKGSNIFGFETGQVTDDSEMAMSMAFAIMDSPNITSLNQNLLFFYYGIWRSTNPPHLGRTTKFALHHFNEDTCSINNETLFDTYKDLIKQSNTPSLANGFLMRISPLVVWYYYMNKERIVNILLGEEDTEQYMKLYMDIKNESFKDSEITHPNEETGVAGGLFVFMALCALLKISAKDILKKLKCLLMGDIFKENEMEMKIKEKIEKMLEELELGKFDYETFTTKISEEHIGFYWHGFSLTIYFLYKFEDIYCDKNITKYRNIMNEICNIGGDTDTNCAIVGSVIGGLIGYRNFGKDFKTFLNLVPKERFMYSSGMMFYYVEYLEDTILNKNTNETTIRFNYYKMLLHLLNNTISL